MGNPYPYIPPVETFLVPDTRYPEVCLSTRETVGVIERPFLRRNLRPARLVRENAGTFGVFIGVEYHLIKINRSYSRYVDANIPKSVPFVGGSSFRDGSGTLTKRSLMKIIESQVENKQKIINFNVGSTTGLLHNTVYTFNPFGNIPIGSGANSRIGSSINVRGLRMSISLSNTGGASIDKERYFRVMVVSHEATYLSGSDVFGSGLGSTELFLQGANEMLFGIPDTHKVTVLYDQRFKVMNTIAATTSICPLDLEVLKGKKMDYSTPTSSYSNHKNYYVVLIPSLPYGTSGVSVVGRVDFESVVDFTD